VSELSPPRLPRVALRVGVTGHRPHKLDAATETQLRSSVQHVLRIIKDAVELIAQSHTGVSVPSFYAAEKPALRIVSPLAEGADRIVADEALTLGYELQAVLPFAREEYEHDFTDATSRQEFVALLGQATAILELDGHREHGPEAYHLVGRVLLAQCDVLLTIWDGGASGGPGGTGQVVGAAESLGMPIAWIDARAPHDCVVLRHGTRSPRKHERLATLSHEIDRLLIPDEEVSGVLHATYFAGGLPSGPVLPLLQPYSWFLGMLARRRRPRRQPVEASGELPVSPTKTDERWADELAERYGAKYRNSFVAVYVFGAIAVMLALGGYVSPLFTTLEFVTMMLISVLVWRARTHHWHERWLNYRLLTEQFRQIELLWPLGRALPSFHLPAHAADEDRYRRWINWFFRARLREIGQPNERINAGYLDTYRQFLIARIDEQAEYHRNASERSGRVVRHAHAASLVLFGLVMLICVFHLVSDGSVSLTGAGWHFFIHGEDLRSAGTRTNGVFTFAAAALPAFGAALAGILSQAEFDRIRRRSAAMSRWLADLSRRLTARNTPLTSEACAAIAEKATESMSAELLDWRLTFKMKDVEAPG
jgi:hypothetical protein